MSDSDDLAPTRPTAATVIAVLCLVFSAMGLCCSPFSAFQVYGIVEANNGVINAAAISQSVLVLVGLVLAMIGLVAGIALLQNFYWGRALTVGYFITQMVATVAALPIGLLVINAEMKNTPDMPPEFQPFLLAFTMIGSSCSVIGFLVAYGFGIYFLTRPKIVAWYASQRH